MKVKESATQVLSTTKRVISNGETFIQAVSLLVIASWSYHTLHQVKVAEAVQWVVTVALVVIALRGFYELFKFLDK
jgi:hypothetical protein